LVSKNQFMKFLWFLSVAALTFSMPACQRTQIAGADRDAHGCIASAGYVWSPLTGACVRVFEAGLPFEPTAMNPEQNYRVYLVTTVSGSGKLKAAELFWPGESTPWKLDVTDKMEDGERHLVLQSTAHQLKIYRNPESAYLLEQNGRVVYVFGPKPGNPLDTIGQ
jgi:hypothetical protein